MSSIKKTIIIDGREHFIAIESSLEINEVEITATEQMSGKIIHVSLSSLLKNVPQKEITNELLQLTQEEQKNRNSFLSTSLKNDEENDSNNVINDIFG